MSMTIRNADYLLDPNRFRLQRATEIHATRFLSHKLPLSRMKEKGKIHAALVTAKTKWRLTRLKRRKFLVFLGSNEPSVCNMRESAEDILRFSRYYNLILVTDPLVLRAAPNAVLFPYGTTFLNKQAWDTRNFLGQVTDDFTGFPLRKHASLSFLKSNKPKASHQIVPGYPLREEVWNSKQSIKQNTIFYYSNISPEHRSELAWDGPLPNDDKLSIFSSIASIIIENSREQNYFSEKLIDCLLTKTVPVYWGAPNIADFFDVSGFICFETVDEMISRINQCDLQTFYRKNTDAIERNFLLARKYATNFSDRVSEAIRIAMEINN
jgi:hypothetical protein